VALALFGYNAWIANACTSDVDCNLLGSCGADGACVCDPGWTSDNCKARIPGETAKPTRFDW
jgi:hypothetical protein